MNNKKTVTGIIFRDLKRADVVDLKKEIASHKEASEGSFQFNEEKLPDGRLGDPVSIILVASISSAAIGVIGAWLLKKRKSDTIRYIIDIEYSDGSKKRSMLEVTHSTSESPSAEIIEILAEMTGIPIEDFLRYTSK